MTEEQKSTLSKFIGPDGKINATDDMPEDLKAAINYLNENNVGLFSDIPGKDDEEEAVDYDDVSDVDFEGSEVSVSNESIASAPIEVNEDSNVDDLNSIF